MSGTANVGSCTQCREVVFKPGVARLGGLDSALCATGVEITVRTGRLLSDAEERRIVLTRKDLVALVEALQGPLGIVFEQIDWTEDWT